MVHSIICMIIIPVSLFDCTKPGPTTCLEESSLELSLKGNFLPARAKHICMRI